MNEMERDYLIARAFVAGFVDEAVKLLLAVVVIFVVLWIIGVILMFWPVALVVAIVWAVWAYASGSAPAPNEQFMQVLTAARSAMPNDVPNVRWDECALWTLDGEFVAPDFATLVQWAREGRVPPQSYIFTCDIGAWRIAYDIEQLAPFFAHAGNTPT